MKKNFNYSIFVFISILFIFSLIHYFAPIGPLDEIWKYHHSKAITLGYIPYKDINLITTPFYFFFVSLFLKINDSFIMFKIFQVIMWSFIYFIIYLIFTKYFNKYLASFFVYFLILIMLLKSSSNYMFDYNGLNFFIILLLTYIFSFKNLNEKTYFFIGFLLGLADLTKQSVGLFLVVAIFLLIFFIEFNRDKRLILYCFLGIFIPNFIFLVYLLINGIFYDFFDYCLFGLNEFSENCFYFGFFKQNPLNIIFFIIGIYVLLLCLIKFFKQREIIYLVYFINNIILLCFGYPIFDNNHIFYFFLYSFFIYILLSKDILFIPNKILNIVFNFVIFIINIFLIFTIYYSEDYLKSNLSNFQNLYITQDLELNTFILDSYIDKNYVSENVLVLSGTSAIYSIANDEYNGIYDLFFYGNIGTKNHVECIKKELDKGRIICISKYYEDETKYNSKEVYPYLKENAILIDSYDVYEFYQKIE